MGWYVLTHDIMKLQIECPAGGERLGNGAFVLEECPIFRQNNLVFLSAEFSDV